MPLSPHVPELTALELFLDVAAGGSIGAAGRAQGISQQAASSRLRSLERRLGVTVLDRGATGSRLTEAGVALAAWAARVVAAATELDDAAAALRHTGAARLRLAASMTVAEHLVPGWLVALRAASPPDAAPSVTLTATNSDAVVALVGEGAADLGFVEGPRVPAGVYSQVVARDRLVLVVAPDHPWAARRRAVSPADLAGTALVAREPGSGTRRAFEEALGRPGRAPVQELGTSTAVREAVRSGLGPAVLSVLAVRDDLDAGRLVAVRVSGLELGRELRAVWSGAATPAAGPARDLLAIAARRTSATSLR
ncbi:LysR family transcriptional regulator [Modestobacter sp. Leaf380]|uniref:LysR family transcriptional regulator n=1 Tax=Modestobacter sp. Leaf380 TaxID=1736356 RepID=UPI0006F46BBA|nr:LysR family transcriptional regulator [Modestobacter sp. Leaf380]KQS64988.1 LysR family transcriptional regulator [Modestobacter sp. Leaf380]